MIQVREKSRPHRVGEAGVTGAAQTLEMEELALVIPAKTIALHERPTARSTWRNQEDAISGTMRSISSVMRFAADNPEVEGERADLRCP
jgi:hypothetical protein